MEVLGLPLHPLILHVTVVVVPLVALGGIVVAVWKWARDRYGVLVLAGALVGLVSTWITRESGKDLYDSLPAHSPAMDTHMNLASPVLWWVLGMFVGQAVLMAGEFLGRRDHPAARILHWVGVVLTIVFGIACVIVVSLAGHAGAVAVWGG